MRVNAFELFLKQKRFDLIFKYLYIKNKDKHVGFYEDLYVEHIRAFNNFHEIVPSDGIPKESKEDFVKSFNRLYENMSRNGFNKSDGVIPIGDNGEIQDGAHRLACAAVLGLDVDIEPRHTNWLWDYKFFQDQAINPDYADYAALEYVKLNPNAYIVNLQPVIQKKYDQQVEKILEKYGFIYYKKDIKITFNGLVNLKKLSYGSFWENNCCWIGTPEDCFAGAVHHAKKSFGWRTLRAYVFVCKNFQDVIAAKAEIRALFNIGNFCVHINDTHEEAVALAQAYFNKNSLHMINKRPYNYEDKHFDAMVDELRNTIIEHHIDIDEVCGAGSTPLDIYGVRSSKDLDFLYCGEQDFDIQTGTLSNHDSELLYYPASKKDIVLIPENYFYYKGLKFITLQVLYDMKRKRREIPKDVADCKRIRKIWKPKKQHIWNSKIYKEIKEGKKQTLISFNLIKKVQQLLRIKNKNTV